MNRKQQIVILIGALAVAYSLLVVTWMTLEPMDSPAGNQLLTKYEHRLFNSPPENSMAIKPPEIVWMYQIQQIGLILAVNALLLFLLRSKKKRTTAVYTAQQTSPQAAF
jgi:hypothetical protein